MDHCIENLRAVCLWCHEHIHLEVEESKTQGWIVKDWPQIEGAT